MEPEDLWDGLRGEDEAAIAEDAANAAAAGVDLIALLDQIEKARAAKDEMDSKLKTLTSTVKGLEAEAIKQLQLLGMKACRTASRTWSVSEFISITVPKENRDRVLEVAEGIVDSDGNTMADEIRTVMTQTLRSWLLEQHRNNENKDQSAPLASGTAFDGLVSEYRSFRLGMARRG